MEKTTSEESARSCNSRSASHLGEGAVCRPSRVEGLPSSHTVQAKMDMTAPGDAFETEADRVADSVVSGFGSSVSSSGESPVICAYGGISGGVPHNMESQLNAAQGGGMPLPSGLKSMMEGGFGRDLSSVRIHTDAAAADMSELIDARAFTSGQDIYFNTGEFSPDTLHGQHLIAHEITHTLQQCGGIAREDKKTTPKPRVKEMDEEDLNYMASSDSHFWCQLLQRVIFLDSGVEVPLNVLNSVLGGIYLADRFVSITRKGSIRKSLRSFGYPADLSDKIIPLFEEDDWRFSIAKRHTEILDRQVPGGWNTTVAAQQFRTLAQQNKDKTSERSVVDEIEYYYLLYKADRNENLNPFENPGFLVQGSTWTTIFGIEVALIASVFTAGVTGAIGASSMASVGISIVVGTLNDIYQLGIEYSTGKESDKKQIEDHIAARLSGIVVKNVISGGFFRLGSVIGDSALGDGVKALLGVLVTTFQESINIGVQAISTATIDGKTAASAVGNVAAGGFSGHGSALGQTIGIVIPAVVEGGKAIYEHGSSDNQVVPYSVGGFSLPGSAVTYLAIMKAQ